MEDILKDRIRIALNPDTISEDVISMVAEIAGENMISLYKQELLCLLGIARTLRSNTETNTGKSYSSYKIACKEYGEKIKSRYQFWRYIDTLRKCAFISKSPTERGEYGNTSIIKLFDIPVQYLEDEIRLLLINPNKKFEI